MSEAKITSRKLELLKSLSPSLNSTLKKAMRLARRQHLEGKEGSDIDNAPVQERVGLKGKSNRRFKSRKFILHPTQGWKIQPSFDCI
jgi:hypothetical protein